MIGISRGHSEAHAAPGICVVQGSTAMNTGVSKINEAVQGVKQSLQTFEEAVSRLDSNSRTYHLQMKSLEGRFEKAKHETKELRTCLQSSMAALGNSWSHLQVLERKMDGLQIMQDRLEAGSGLERGVLEISHMAKTMLKPFSNSASYLFVNVEAIATVAFTTIAAGTLGAFLGRS